MIFFLVTQKLSKTILLLQIIISLLYQLTDNVSHQAGQRRQ